MSEQADVDRLLGSLRGFAKEYEEEARSYYLWVEVSRRQVEEPARTVLLGPRPTLASPVLNLGRVFKTPSEYRLLDKVVRMFLVQDGLDDDNVGTDRDRLQTALLRRAQAEALARVNQASPMERPGSK